MVPRDRAGHRLAQPVAMTPSSRSTSVLDGRGILSDPCCGAGVNHSSPSRANYC